MENLVFLCMTPYLCVYVSIFLFMHCTFTHKINGSPTLNKTYINWKWSSSLIRTKYLSELPHICTSDMCIAMDSTEELAVHLPAWTKNIDYIKERGNSMFDWNNRVKRTEKIAKDRKM